MTNTPRVTVTDDDGKERPCEIVGWRRTLGGGFVLRVLPEGATEPVSLSPVNGADADIAERVCRAAFVPNEDLPN